jgi:Cu/Ag efflux protein CusF
MFTRIAVAVALCIGAGNASAAQKEFTASRTETVSAKVKDIDQQSRKVTLVGKDGAETSFTAKEEVRNLDKVKAGDTVSATIHETLTLRVLGKDEPAPDLAGGAAVQRKEGGQPGGVMSADVSGVAVVEKIDPNKKWVALKGPKGNVMKLAVADPANLDGVAVGTRVGFSYAEMLAVDVLPGKEKGKEKKK